MGAIGGGYIRNISTQYHIGGKAFAMHCDDSQVVVFQEIFVVPVVIITIIL
jgi:hypothetical protein